MQDIIDAVSGILSDYILISLLLLVALYFTFATRGVQFGMVGEMIRLLIHSGRKYDDSRNSTDENHHAISSFQAFALSIASRVGTGNLAGVGTAIAVGGPGAIFWMWVIALIGAASAFIESTLAQLFKVKGNGSFYGGPAYYIWKGLHQRWWAVTFAILITITFGFAFNTVQANTIAESFHSSFSIPTQVSGIVLAVATLAIIFGGVQRVSRFSEIIVPVMAILYIILAIVIICINISRVPQVIELIISNAFGFNEILGGSMGSALIMGIKRGLFSNEAGEGSTPNAAATASVTHPVKQGLIQALGVYTDTLLICTATAFIILCSGIYLDGHDGIVLTQHAIDSGLGGTSHLGSTFVSIAIFFFAFTSIIANYYYGETNIRFIRDSKMIINAYRLAVGLTVYIGALMSLKMVWGFADITMALMTICNLVAIAMLGRYAIILLKDYKHQRSQGLDPTYHSSTIPEIKSETECWS